MANYANLKSDIAGVIRTNNNEEITGDILQEQLLGMVDSLGAGFQYKGVATPTTAPGTPDENVFYIASTAGTYTNFGSLVVAEGEVAILKYNGSWAKEVTGAATAAQVTQLGQGVDELKMETTVGNFAPVTLEETRNIRPTSGGIVTGNNDYTYIAKVSSGDSIRIYADVKSDDYMRVGFTVDYPANGVSVSGYFTGAGGSDGADLSFVRTAPANGYLVVSCASDFNSIEIGVNNNSIGTKVYEAEAVNPAINAVRLVKAGESINNFDKSSSDIIRNYYVIDGRYAPGGGYAITHPIYVKAGVQYKYPHDSVFLSSNYNIAICEPDGAYIQNIVGIFSDGYVTFTPAEDCFVRLNIGRAANIDSFMVCNAEDYPASYVPFARSIGDNYHLGETQINDVREIVAPFQQVVDHFVTEKSVNLFNKASALIKNGYYSGGRLISNESYRVTHPIKVSAGVSYKAVFRANDLGTSNTGIAVVDGDNNILYFVNGVVSGNYITITPAEDCYLSFNIGQYTRLDEMMVCIEADYPESYEPYYEYTKLVRVEVESASSPLTGKSVIFTGDSICYGATDTPQGAGWAKRIGEKNNMGWQNKAVSGGTIMNKDLIGSSFTICDTDFGTGADYIILEGGTNDADRIGSITGGNTPQYYGSWNESDYVTEFGKDTFCDAVQRLIQRVVTSFPTARVGFIIAPKMGVSNSGFDAAHNNRRAYFQTIIEICRKWGVPVLNLWDECTMNPRLAAHYTEAEHGPLYHDGQHPTAEGYELITPIIEKWMESL